MTATAGTFWGAARTGGGARAKKQANRARERDRTGPRPPFEMTSPTICPRAPCDFDFAVVGHRRMWRPQNLIAILLLKRTAEFGTDGEEHPDKAEVVEVFDGARHGSLINAASQFSDRCLRRIAKSRRRGVMAECGEHAP